MPFLVEKHFPVPTKDILSYYFDEPQFDQDKPLYIDALDTKRFWTARQTKDAIRKLAAGFKALGLAAGDCVCIHSFNSIDYPVLVNGIAGFGGVYTGSNPAYQAYEIAHHLKAANVRMIVVEPDLLPSIVGPAAECDIRKEHILVFGDRSQKGHSSWMTLFNHGESDWPRFDDLEAAKGTTLARLFSSGTTGLPKAADLSHYNLIAEHQFFSEWQSTPWQARRIVILPMFHAATAPICHYAPLRSGDECFIAKRFELELYLRLVEEHQITEGAFVPPMVGAIINSPLKDKYSLKSIRIAHGGAAPLDKWSQNKLQELLHPECPITQVWGMTETSCVSSLTPWPHREPTGLVGQMLPNMDSKLVDDEGKDITAYDVRGELCVRGPLVFQGYFQNPEANAQDFDSDGFFHTGDIAYCDSKTRLWYIMDRKKELIKVRGFQVAPAELEAVLLKHDSIADAAIIGVPSNTGSGELPRAYLVRKQGHESLTERAVKEYITKMLASYKRLDGGVVFVEAIPKTPSGKKLKRILKDQAAEEMGKKAAKL